MLDDNRLLSGLADLGDGMAGGGYGKPITGGYTLVDADRGRSVAERAVVYDDADEAYVPLDVVAADGDGAALHAEMAGLGLRGGGSHGNMASGLMPVAALQALDGLSNMVFARPSLAVANAEPNDGPVVSQDVVALRADIAQEVLGFDGSDVTIGILSDSFATAEDPLTTFEEDLAAGELPDVEILQDLSVPGSDEGRAMAQLIHDIAPGADIVFATAFEGPASFAANIDALVAADVDIIVDDVFFLGEPMFQDGVIAQAAANAVEAGIPFFSSAGNAGIAGYEAPFRTTEITGPGGGALHDWDSGDGVDPFLDIVIPAQSSAALILQWDDPFLSGNATGPAGTSSPGANTDLDFGLLAEASPDAEIISASANFNIGADPVEFLLVENTSDEDLSAALAIENFEGPDPGTMRIVGIDVPFDDFVLGYNVEFEDEFRASTTFGHSVAEGVIGVGASDFFLTPEFGAVGNPFPADLTALGGSTILFDENGERLARPDVRDAVDITASNNGNTTFFGADLNLEEGSSIFPDGDPDQDTFPNFSGTSAAAPNAAAVAALMLQAAPSLNPDGIEFLLQATATDIRPDFELLDADVLEFATTEGLEALAVGVEHGPDARTGAGLIDAAVAVAAADLLEDGLVSFERLVADAENLFSIDLPPLAGADPLGLAGLADVAENYLSDRADLSDQADRVTNDLERVAEAVLDDALVLLPGWPDDGDQFLA